MSALPPEAGHDVEVKLLRNLVVFGRTLQGVAYLANDENVMSIFNQLLRQIQSKCGAKWPKTAQYLQTHLQSNLQDLRSLTSNDHSIRTHISPTAQVIRPQHSLPVDPPIAAHEASSATDATRSRPVVINDPPQSGQRKADTALNSASSTGATVQLQSRRPPAGPPEINKQGSPKKSGTNPQPVQVVLGRSDSAPPSDQISASELMKSNFVSVWLGPECAFKGLDELTRIACAHEVGAHKGVQGGGPQWTQGDVQGCFRSAIGEKLPAICLFEAAAAPAKKKRTHEVDSVPQQRESKSQRTKRRKREFEAEDYSIEPSQPALVEAEMTRKAAAAAIAIRRNASPVKGPIEQRRINEPLIETVGATAPLPEWRPDGSSWQETGALPSSSESVDEDPAAGTGEELYNVEMIIDMMKDQVGREFYLIKWEGYPDSDNTWEPVENIEAFGNHSARIRYLRAWYQARLKVSKRLARDPDYEWRPVTMQDKQLEEQMVLFIEKERASTEKFHTKAASAKTPGLN